VIRRDSRAQSLHIVVEMRFQSSGDICGAPLVIYCISSLCTERFDCQNHAIPCALIRQITVATIEIGHCRSFIYITIMNSVARLSLIFSLTTTTNHFPFPHICNKTSIMDGTIIHAINATSIKPASQYLRGDTSVHTSIHTSISPILPDPHPQASLSLSDSSLVLLIVSRSIFLDILVNFFSAFSSFFSSCTKAWFDFFSPRDCPFLLPSAL